MSARAARLRVEMKPLNDELKELREIAQPSDKEAARQLELITELKSLAAEHKKAEEQYQESLTVEAEFKNLDDQELEVKARYDGPTQPNGTIEQIKPGMSWFDVMTERKSFQRAIRDGMPIREKVPINTLYPFESKAAFQVTNPGLTGPDVQVINSFTTLTRHPILDLINTTVSNRYHIDYLPLTFTNAATEVPWGTAKPESTNAGTILSVTMSTIAHWKEVVRQQLHYMPELRGEIEAEMSEGVLRILENRIINGTGVAPMMNGLLSQITQAGTGADLVAQIFNAIATVEGAGGTVDAIVVNPTNVSQLMQYEWANNKYNTISTPNSFAGYRLVKSSVMPAGRALVGDWAMAVRLYIGDALSVESTETLGFKSNIVTFRGEIDAVVLAIRPWLMVDCTGTIPADAFAAAADEPKARKG